ncbi:hypothetical protein [Roseibium sp. RKSG952]|uniref:hypothetical protein n=1 Tax=Roseibium sp. RKSG952 TaxID=2529384 RepID=UPI0012BC6139|nr:hypothetical protein [Roseibium sp. RKSG952]MTH95921.1 hypothetical protein [Roseibium sp. RKSG952]
MGLQGKFAVLLNGPPRSGKDTASEALMDALGSDCDLLKFTRPVKDLTHARRGLDVLHDHFESLKDTPLDEFGGKTPREAYIETGARERAENGDDAVANMFVKSVVESKCAVILNDDVGGDMEAEAVANALGFDRVLVIRVHRKGCDFSNDCRDWVRSDRLCIHDVRNEEGRRREFQSEVAALVRAFLKKSAPELSAFGSLDPIRAA